MAAGADKPWRSEAGAVVVRVRATPKADRDGLDGLIDTAQGSAIKVRVRAAPEDGAANAAIERTLASALGARQSDVGVIAGHQARVKSVKIAGDPDALAASLEALLASPRTNQKNPKKRKH